jgi:hypothetical protein
MVRSRNVPMAQDLLSNIPMIEGFFPYPANGDWPTAFDTAFSTDVLASFNQSRFDFDGFKDQYKAFNQTIGLAFKTFDHGFLTVVGVPNSNGDKGGFVYVTGWEGGEVVTGQTVWYEDATFAVVKDVGNGVRKIIEFRESSNIPNSAPLVPQQNWTCSLP